MKGHIIIVLLYLRNTKYCVVKVMDIVSKWRVLLAYCAKPKSKCVTRNHHTGYLTQTKCYCVSYVRSMSACSKIVPTLDEKKSRKCTSYRKTRSIAQSRRKGLVIITSNIWEGLLQRMNQDLTILRSSIYDRLKNGS